MSLLTLLRLNLSRPAAGTIADSSASSEVVVAAGIFSVASATTSVSTHLAIATGLDSAIVITTSTSIEANVATGVFSVTVIQSSLSSELVQATVTDATGAVDASRSTESVAAAALAAHVIDISTSSEFIGPVRWIGAGRWSTSGLTRPIPASVEKRSSRSSERVLAAVVMRAAVVSGGRSSEEVIGEIVPADFWTLNREVMLAELDEDLLAVAS